MAEAKDVRGRIYQNLVDAGCGQQMAERCMILIQENKRSELLNMLSAHRKNLLDQMHASQKQIDCLDYLVYSLKKH